MTNGLSATKFDHEIEDLAARLARLDRRKQTAFFAACGEGLLPLYEQFSRETQWGDALVLRRGLDAAWRYAEDGSRAKVSELLEQIESLVPHSDDFPTPASSYAQDAAICIDSALRAASASEQVDPTWVEYALEPVKVSLCLQQRGLIDVGSTAEDLGWLDGIVKEPRMVRALEFCRSALARLSSAGELQADDIRALRASVRALRPEST